MADFSTLIASIEETIKTNGVQAITGQILQDEMLLMVSAINQLKQDTLEGYAFYGEPLADEGSASVTQNTFFLVTAGTYTINGNTFAVTGEGVSVVAYDSVNDEVRNEGLILPFDNAPTSGSSNPITSGAVADALAEIPANFAACLYDRRSAGTPQSPYTFRQSGGDGVDYLKSIKGRTLVWNQLVPETLANLSDKGVTAVKNANGTYTLNGTATTGTNLLSGAINIISGHTYILSTCIVSSGPNTNITGLTGQLYKADSILLSCSLAKQQVKGSATGTGAAEVRFHTDGGNVFDNVVVALNLTDLTLLGWVPSTVDEFRAVCPLSYYSYTPALLINNAATDLESTGFNQWDEVAEEGNISTTDGQDIPFTGLMRTKNYIRVIPGGNYYFRIGAAQKPYRLYYYNAAKNYLGYVAWQNSRNVTIPSDTYYIRFALDSSYGTTYNHDICINISDPSRNGTYEPYWKATRHLGLDSLQAKEVGSDTIVTINGLDGVGDSVDLLKDGKTLTKNRARVDLGDLTWGYNSTDAYFFANISGKAVGVEGIACAKYAVTTAALSSLPDKSIRGDASNNAIYIKDTAYSDAATFKAAMSGVYLDYALATPKEYELVEPIQPMLEVDELGTERRLPEDTAAAVNAPFESDSNYSVSVANLVRKLSE